MRFGKPASHQDVAAATDNARHREVPRPPRDVVNLEKINANLKDANLQAMQSSGPSALTFAS
jgi:hypothetical protein